MTDSLIQEIFTLSGRRAVVVGGTGVLGGRFAEVLAGAGAEVVVMGRSQERGEDAVQRAGSGAWFHPIDVTSRESITTAARAVADRGGADILINAPGLNSSTPFEKITDEEWDTLLSVNLGSMFRTIQSFLPQLKDRPGGACVINISSSAAAIPISRVLGYGVAKAGVNNLTQYLARELAPHRVRVNAIVPGFFPAEQNRKLLTEQRVADVMRHTPMRRLGEPSELDGAVVWLASERAAGFVTGALICVDGGFAAMTI